MQISKTKGMSILTSVMEVALQCALFYGIAIVLYVAMFNLRENRINECLWVAAAVIVAYFMRRFINSPRLYMIISFIIPIAAYMAGTTWNLKISNFFFGLIIYGYSLKVKKSTDEFMKKVTGNDGHASENILKMPKSAEKVSIYFVLVLVVGYMIAQLLSKPLLMYVEMLLAISFVVLSIIYNDLWEMQLVFSSNGGKTEFPARQIKQVNAFTMIASVVLIVIVMLLLYGGPFDGLFKLITAGGGYLLKGFFTVMLFIIRLTGTETGKKYDYDREEETTEEDASELDDLEYPDNALMESIAEVTLIVISALLIAAIVYMLYVYIKNLTNSRKYGSDYIEYIKPVSDKEKTTKSRKKQDKPKGEVKSIRKLYKNLIIKNNKDKEKLKTRLPEQITIENLAVDKETAEKITYLYEKARYSNEIITSKDVDDFRKLS